jgi:hypothetical protein
MKTIRLDFKYFWPGFNPRRNWFFYHLRKRYRVVLTENADFVIFSVFTGEPLARDANGAYIFKMPQIKGDFAKIFYTYEPFHPDMDKCDWAFSFAYDEEMGNPRHMRFPYYACNPNSASFIDSGLLIKKDTDFMRVKREKARFCSFIYGNQYPKFRKEFFDKLSLYKRVDAPGLVKRNIELKASGIKRHRSFISRLKTGFRRPLYEDKYGPKLEFMRPYKFDIVFENCELSGYITQRMTHAMQSLCIPVFWGNPLVQRDFNPGSFLNFYDYGSVEKLIERIIEVDNNDKLYEEYLRQPWFYDNKPSKYFDEQRVVNRLYEIFG